MAAQSGMCARAFRARSGWRVRARMHVCRSLFRDCASLASTVVRRVPVPWEEGADHWQVDRSSSLSVAIPRAAVDGDVDPFQVLVAQFVRHA